MKRFLLVALALFLLGYVGVVIYFVNAETSLVFNPSRDTPQPPDSLRAKVVTITSTDSVVLVGWMMRASEPELDPDEADALVALDENDESLRELAAPERWVIYLHGNTGDVSYPLNQEKYMQFQKLGISVLAIDYRGYGRSSGTPSEKGAVADARAAWDYLTEVYGADPRYIYIMGYSLGTGVATQLAAQVQAAGLILEAAYTSLAQVGQNRHWYLPVKLVMENQFPTEDFIPQVQEPLLLLHSAEDESIPLSMGQELLAKANEPKKLVELKGKHEEAHRTSQREYWQAVAQFLKPAAIP